MQILRTYLQNNYFIQEKKKKGEKTDFPPLLFVLYKIIVSSLLWKRHSCWKCVHRLVSHQRVFIPNLFMCCDPPPHTHTPGSQLCVQYLMADNCLVTTLKGTLDKEASHALLIGMEKKVSQPFTVFHCINGLFWFKKLMAGSCENKNMSTAIMCLAACVCNIRHHNKAGMCSRSVHYAVNQHFSDFSLAESKPTWLYPKKLRFKMKCTSVA